MRISPVQEFHTAKGTSKCGLYNENILSVNMGCELVSQWPKTTRESQVDERDCVIKNLYMWTGRVDLFICDEISTFGVECCLEN